MLLLTGALVGHDNEPSVAEGGSVFENLKPALLQERTG